MEALYLGNELTTSINPDNVLMALARANCLNLANEVDFNKYGVKDNIGLLPVSNLFIDSVIVKLKSPLEQVDHVSILRDLINSNGMMLCGITAFENNKFKISCPDYTMSTVMNFINLLESSNFKVNCIDVTQDFAGSFDKDELTRHLMEKHGFVKSTFISKSHPTIIPQAQEAHTCLQYWNGKSLRCKVYLKMPEILQSKSVRANVGNRWLQWVVKNNHLAKSRNESVNRGLTRVEVSCYMDEYQYDQTALSSANIRCYTVSFPRTHLQYTTQRNVDCVL